LPIPLATVGEWIDVLELASKWALAAIREIAIENLGGLATPVDKVVLGRHYGIEQWLGDAFFDLCTRSETLSLPELRRMDLEDVARVIQVREMTHQSSFQYGGVQIRELVAQTFGYPVSLIDVAADQEQQVAQVVTEGRNSLFPAVTRIRLL
jgi:hypothetical protein